jgi:hypothetical protein
MNCSRSARRSSAAAATCRWSAWSRRGVYELERADRADGLRPTCRQRAGDAGGLRARGARAGRIGLRAAIQSKVWHSREDPDVYGEAGSSLCRAAHGHARGQSGCSPLCWRSSALRLLAQRHAAPNEIGVHCAGAPVAGAVAGDECRAHAIGAAFGLPAAWAASRFISSMLYGLRPTDAITMAVATAVLMTAGLFAGFCRGVRRTSITSCAHTARQRTLIRIIE